MLIGNRFAGKIIAVRFSLPCLPGMREGPEQGVTLYIQ